MPATLGPDLVLQEQPARTGRLPQVDRALHVDGVAVARVGIDDDRSIPAPRLAHHDRRRHRVFGPARATTPSRSTARSAAPRCAARCRVHAERELARGPRPGRLRRRRRPSRPPALLADWAGERLVLVVLAEERGRTSALSFRNLARVVVLPADGVGVADLVGAALAARHRGRARRSSPRAPRASGIGRGRRRDRRRRGRLAMDPSQVIIRPVVSEKSYVLAANDKYTFRVHPDAHKTQIRQASRSSSTSSVVEVRTASVKSKPKRRGLTAGRTRSWKKAIVQVRPGDPIPIFQGLQGLEGVTPMPIRKPKPTSPGRRFVDVRRLRRDHELRAREVARRGAQEERRAQRARPQDRPPPRRRRQAPVPQDRLQAPQGRRAGEGRRDRVRPEPLRLHRAAALRRRREALHPGAAPPARRHDRRVRAAAPRSRSATACRWRDIPTGTVVHNVELQPGRGGQLGALGRRRDPADGEGRRHGDPAPALGRDAHGPRRVPRDRRHDRQRRPPERQGRQGRPQAPHGRAPADARHRDEPGRPPARRRRGLDHRRPPPGHAVGRADARLPHAQEEQGVRPLHRARPPPREGQA